MPSKPSVNIPNWVAWCLFAACAATIAAVVTIQLAAGRAAMPLDDSYIYCGYAKMFYTPRGGLFSYNPGEHSAGTTSFLYYYLLVLVTGIVKLFAGHAIPTADDTMTATNLIAAACLAGVFTVGTATLRKATSQTGEWPLMAVLFVCVALANPETFWAAMNGLDNSLTMLLLTLLSADLIRGGADETGKPGQWVSQRSGALLGLIAGCRLEWIPITAIVLIGFSVSIMRSIDGLRSRLTAVGGGAAIYGGVLLAICLPMRLTVGRWTPTSFGSRVQPSLGTLADAFHNLKAIHIDYWFGFSLISLFLGLAAWKHARSTAWAFPAVSLCYLLMHWAIWGDTLGIRDRYVSYLAPGLALSFAVALSSVRQAYYKRQTPVSGSLACGILMIALTLWSVSVSLKHLAEDTVEMQQVSVEPTLWMQKHLPPSARVSVEEAGAIRLYTSFYLVDRVGLTTDHFWRYLAHHTAYDYSDFLKTYSVEYVFDYPGQVPLASIQNARPLGEWQATHVHWSLGPIVCCRVGPAR